ncbi:50S ribosomal protein L17 [Patescibacteria group bacterium]
MSKNVSNIKLGRKRDARNMLIRNLVTSLILHEKIKTTYAKARILKAKIEKVITVARRSNKLVSKRYLNGYLLDKNATKKVFEVLIPEFKDRKSGVVRMLQTGPRAGDSAKMVFIELLLPKKVKKTESKPEEVKKDAKKTTEKPQKEKVKSGVKTTVKLKK